MEDLLLVCDLLDLSDEELCDLLVLHRFQLFIFLSLRRCVHVDYGDFCAFDPTEPTLSYGFPSDSLGRYYVDLVVYFVSLFGIRCSCNRNFEIVDELGDLRGWKRLLKHFTKSQASFRRHGFIKPKIALEVSFCAHVIVILEPLMLVLNIVQSFVADRRSEA